MPFFLFHALVQPTDCTHDFLVLDSHTKHLSGFAAWFIHVRSKAASVWLQQLHRVDFRQPHSVWCQPVPRLHRQQGRFTTPHLLRSRGQRCRWLRLRKTRENLPYAHVQSAPSDDVVSILAVLSSDPPPLGSHRT